MRLPRLQTLFTIRFAFLTLFPCDIPADWLDNTRDVLNFVENYLPTGEYDASAAPLPTHIQRVPPSIARSRVQDGFQDRRLVGLGHSAGGCVLCVASYCLTYGKYRLMMGSANAACVRPNLFLSLTLVDPVIMPDYPKMSNLAVGALTRRQTWPSRCGISVHSWSANEFLTLRIPS